MTTATQKKKTKNQKNRSTKLG